MLGIWYTCRNRCQKWMQPLPLPHFNRDDSQMVFTADGGFQILLNYSGLFKSRNQEQLANLSKPILSHSRMRRNVFDSDPTLRLILSTDHVARFFNLSFVICHLRGVINRWSFHHYNLSHNISVSVMHFWAVLDFATVPWIVFVCLFRNSNCFNGNPK